MMLPTDLLVPRERLAEFQVLADANERSSIAVFIDVERIQRRYHPLNYVLDSNVYT